MSRFKMSLKKKGERAISFFFLFISLHVQQGHAREQRKVTRQAGTVPSSRLAVESGDRSDILPHNFKDDSGAHPKWRTILWNTFL